jgi:hypothetical protein
MAGLRFSAGYRFGSELAGLAVAIVALGVFCLPARAQDASDASAPTPISAPPVGPKQPPKNDCPERPPADSTESGDVVVTLDPDTLWRPRGSEVRFTVSGKNGATIAVRRVQVCFGWAASLTAHHKHWAKHPLFPSPLVRAIKTEGSTAGFGAVVPDLPGASWPFRRVFKGGDVAFTALFTVPVADMVVSVTLADGTTAPAVVLLPVGVTRVLYGLILAGVFLALFYWAAWICVARTPIRGHNVFLKAISGRDGYASLSQFQILLWTVTVGACAVYVMALSGNLISLSDGTLILLGIAGGAALAARMSAGPSEAGQNGAPVTQPQPPQADSSAAADKRQPAATDTKPTPAVGIKQATRLSDPNPGPPQWSNLVVVDGTVDLTRVQMLIFTLISAGFVSLQVLVTYTIPEIPINFLLLMGISNGIYVAGRQLPDQSKQAQPPAK